MRGWKAGEGHLRGSTTFLQRRLRTTTKRDTLSSSLHLWEAAMGQKVQKTVTVNGSQPGAASHPHCKQPQDPKEASIEEALFDYMPR